MEERFQQADANHDGKLSREEAFGPLKEQFDRFDADHDGQLTLEEVHKGFEQFRKEGPPRRSGPEAKEPEKAEAK